MKKLIIVMILLSMTHGQIYQNSNIMRNRSNSNTNPVNTKSLKPSRGRRGRRSSKSELPYEDMSEVGKENIFKKQGTEIPCPDGDKEMYLVKLKSKKKEGYNFKIRKLSRRETFTIKSPVPVAGVRG